MTGTIVRKTDKGFGFIQPDDGGKDVFFHAQNVVDGLFDELQENEKVTFDVEQGPKGPAATNVRRA
jgi:cold shock protein